MKKQRIYISGPISGRNLNERRKSFALIEALLRADGHEPFDPMRNGLPEDATTHQHMHRDLAELTREDKPYDAIFMMRGWLHSAGCKLEFDVATSIGLNVIFEELPEPIRFA